MFAVTPGLLPEQNEHQRSVRMICEAYPEKTLKHITIKLRSLNHSSSCELPLPFRCIIGIHVFIKCHTEVDVWVTSRSVQDGEDREAFLL